MNKSKIYRPNYIPVSNFTSNDLSANNSTSAKQFPDESSLLILNANFHFDDFMNKTNPVYADD